MMSKIPGSAFGVKICWKLNTNIDSFGFLSLKVIQEIIMIS